MNTKNVHMFLQSVLFIMSFPLPCFSQQTDTLTPGLILRDPNILESSPRGVFRLGFFSPPNTTNRYLGIFYTFSQETVIWIANRDRPINDSSGAVAIAPDGNLILTNGMNETVWSTNITHSSVRNTTAQINDIGNLVVRDGLSQDVLWQSLMYPLDVFLPAVRAIENTNFGETFFISSWKTPSDPGVGNFTGGIKDLKNLPEAFTLNNGRLHWRSGPWNGEFNIGVQEMYPAYMINGSYNHTGHFYFAAPYGWEFMKITLNVTGTLVQTMWNRNLNRWDTTWLAPSNECDIYGKCGPFGSCYAQDSPICSCFRGFEPVNREEWNRGNWTSGCRRRSRLQCELGNGARGNGDEFLRLQFRKVPDFVEQFPSRHLDECTRRCLNNCSCLAYAYDQTIGCMFWSRSLIDNQRFDGVGYDLYIRLAASELGNHQDRRFVIIIPVVTGVAVIFVGVFIAWCWMVQRKGKRTKDRKVNEAAGKTFSSDSTVIVLKDETEKANIEELPLFTFETLANATNYFSEKNLLGRGGFGTVYKGNLSNGNDVAVKRLSAASGQGNEEFMNEVVVISKLQHRNLVRALGCCTEREEKMLIYEYMPNRSLDGCLLDSEHPSQKILNWKKRLSIIKGIGRGLLYLHVDSRLKIIHRDLKPSNVLLDEDWNPKISDFGIARIFGGNQDHGNTSRVVGTYGYMAPEYATEGRFSEKSDVYSFGVLMLEIISGKKNTHYHNQEGSLSLLGRAWKLWNEDNGFAFVDQTIASASLSFQGEIVRCIHIALLCIQDFPEDRPAIQTALSMLSREIMELPTPQEPIFAEKWNQSQVGTTHQSTSQVGYSINDLTLTKLDGR